MPHVGGDLGRLDLGDHAAGADPGLARAADLDAFEVLGPVHVLDAGAGGARGVAVVEAVHVGEEDQQVGADQVGDEGGEPVVVAEADLVGGDGVVLVDDGERAEGEQLVEGAVGVAVVGAAAGVVAGEQHLAHADAVPREGGGVAGDEQALADAGGGLLAGEVAGAAREAERGEAAWAMAPEETRTISRVPPERAFARTSTRASTRSASSPPDAVVSEEEPTFTTILRA